MTQQRDLARKGFLYIGNRPFTIDELGPAADMRIDAALQYLVDNGVLGDYPKGTEWYKVIDTDDFGLVGPPTDSDDTLKQSLWLDFKNYEAEVLTKESITEDDKTEVMTRLKRFMMADKLTKP